MGATWKLANFASRGIAISEGFKLIINVVLYGSFVVNTVAVANNLYLFVKNFKDMSAGDMLMQISAIAFWTRSMYKFQSAGTIIRNVQNQVINGYLRGLNAQDRQAFDAARVDANNDQLIVELFYECNRNQIDTRNIGALLGLKVSTL